MTAALIYTVTEIYPEHVVLDGNHPLAGIAIRLSLKVEAVREASEAEIGQGTMGAGFSNSKHKPLATTHCTEAATHHEKSRQRSSVAGFFIHFSIV